VRRGAAALSALSLAAGLVAQQPTPPTPPNMVTPPADAVPTTLFSLPDDLEVTLWAKAPMLRNPSNMDVDAQGRVWITEAVNYRKLAGKDPDGDRVIILEDTDGDGVADKTSVFVQEPALLAPLGIAVIDNKIIVSMRPDLIVYTDVDRDGKSRRPRSTSARCC
jgi:glucose/arabinose dehydrogenase